MRRTSNWIDHWGSLNGYEDRPDDRAEVVRRRARSPDGGSIPARPTPARTADVHGITDDDATAPRSGPSPRHCRDTSVGRDLAGFNILNFDLRLLVAQYNRAGLVLPVAGGDRRLPDLPPA